MKLYSSTPKGFTLVEILVVFAIITALAGLTIATLRFAQNSAARNRARGEIGALSVAIEAYKTDNGDYPRDATTTKYTDTLDARVNLSGTIGGTYMPASVILYQKLSGDGANTRQYGVDASGNKQTIYFAFKPNMLYPKVPAGSTDKVQALLDPFRNVYGYSTIQLATADTTKGYNPTFDLWSTADINQTGSTTSNSWITNW